MLQKELIKRLKGRYETKMDDKGWLNVSSDGIPPLPSEIQRQSELTQLKNNYSGENMMIQI